MWGTAGSKEQVCDLCPHACRLKPGSIGRCRQRTVKNGKIVSLNYGEITALAMDPIEKKPLYHFHPGSNILSVGANGCNLHCLYCQNHHIAHTDAPTRRLLPEELVHLAEGAVQNQGNIGIAFTYNEPTVGFEYLRDGSRLAQAAGLKTVLVTNGFLNPEPWRLLLDSLDALNIDVKAFNEDAHHSLCSAPLAPILRNVEQAVKHCHVEITYLVVPGFNDDPQDFRSFISWLASISLEIPLHLTRYFPSYKLKEAPTPLETLEQLAEIAGERLGFVYLGNLGRMQDTLCPRCGTILIRRRGVSRAQSELVDGGCPLCDYRLSVGEKVAAREG